MVRYREESGKARGRRARRTPAPFDPKRLTGLQHYRRMAEAVGGVDGGPLEASAFVQAMLAGMGDETEVTHAGEGAVVLRQTGLRIVRGLTGSEHDNLLACRIELWRGAVASHRAFMTVDTDDDGDTLLRTIHPA